MYKDFNNYSQEELRDILYDEELNLIQLLTLRDCMKKYDFSDYDFKYLEELINDCLDLETNLEEVSDSLYISGFDTSIINDYKEKIDNLKSKDIEEYTLDDVDYMLYNEEFSIVDLFRLYSVMKKLNAKFDDINYVIELINDELDELDQEELIDLKKKVSSLKVDTKLIDEKLKTFSSDVKSGISNIVSGGLMIGGAILKGLASGSTEYDSRNKFKIEYDDEYEPEEDDEYFEDLD